MLREFKVWAAKYWALKSKSLSRAGKFFDFISTSDAPLLLYIVTLGFTLSSEGIIVLTSSIKNPSISFLIDSVSNPAISLVLVALFISILIIWWGRGSIEEEPSKPKDSDTGLAYPEPEYNIR